VTADLAQQDDATTTAAGTRFAFTRDGRL